MNRGSRVKKNKNKGKKNKLLRSSTQSFFDYCPLQDNDNSGDWYDNWDPEKIREKQWALTLCDDPKTRDKYRKAKVVNYTQ